MLSMAELLLNNLERGFPEYIQILGKKGICYGLASTWLPTHWLDLLQGWLDSPNRVHFEERLRWLATDFSVQTIKINSKEYNNFKDIRAYYEQLKIRKDLNKEEAEFVNKMNDVFAFLDSLTVYQSSNKTFLKENVSIEDISAGFNYVASTAFDEIAQGEPVAINAIYSSVRMIDKNKPEPLLPCMQRFKMLAGAQLPFSMHISGCGHIIAAEELNAISTEWHIFDQNKMTKNELYRGFSREEILSSITQKENANLAFIHLTVFVPPLTLKLHALQTLQQQCLNSMEHQTSRKELLENSYRRDAVGANALWLSIKFKDYTLTQDLLDQGSNVNIEANGFTCLGFASGGNTIAAKLLIQAGANINALKPSHYSALQVAAAWGQMDIVKMLLAAGANPTLEKEGLTAAQLAYKNGHAALALLLKAAEVQYDSRGFQSFLMAAKANNIDGIKKLIAQGININTSAITGETALTTAVVAGHEEMTKFLIKSGANVNAKAQNDQGPLHLAIKNGKLDLVKILIAAGADLNAYDANSFTPLHWAVVTGEEEAVKILVKAGVHLEAKADRDETALAIAARCNRLMIFKILQLTGADVTVNSNTQNIAANTLSPVALKTNKVSGRDAFNHYETQILLINAILFDKVAVAKTMLNNKNTDNLKYNDLTEEYFLKRLDADNFSVGSAEAFLKILGSKKLLSPQMTLMLFRVALEKTSWKTPQNMAGGEPLPITHIHGLISIAQDKALKDPDTKQIIWDQALRDVQKILRESIVKKPVTLSSLFAGDPIQKKYEEFTQLLNPYVLRAVEQMTLSADKGKSPAP